MADEIVRRASVRARAYTTNEKGDTVKHQEPGLFIGNNEIILISKSDAMILIDEMRKLLKRMI
jgi:hypothetical protein